MVSLCAVPCDGDSGDDGDDDGDGDDDDDGDGDDLQAKQAVSKLLHLW